MRALLKGLIASIGLAASAMCLANEVALDHMLIKKAAQTPGGFCPFCISITGEVQVENIAYEKELTLHYSINGNPWQTTEGFFEKSLNNNQEIWTLRAGTGFLPGGRADVEFAIEYKVNDHSYWDNNSGVNYTLSATTDRAGAYIDDRNVVAKNYKVVHSSFRGEVYLKNLALEKKVNIVYSYDNWETSLVGSASFEHTANNPEFEAWGFNLQVPIAVDAVEFAVAYEVNGVTYWSNNNGDNYTALRAPF